MAPAFSASHPSSFHHTTLLFGRLDIYFPLTAGTPLFRVLTAHLICVAAMAGARRRRRYGAGATLRTRSERAGRRARADALPTDYFAPSTSLLLQHGGSPLYRTPFME